MINMTEHLAQANATHVHADVVGGVLALVYQLWVDIIKSIDSGHLLTLFTKYISFSKIPIKPQNSELYPH